MVKQLERLTQGNSYLNLIVGIVVVVAIVAIVAGLIRNKNVILGPKTEQTQQEGQAPPSPETASLPTKHTVAAGEDLWKISEKYYKTGYNWVDIANENKLANPNRLLVGIELTIPDVPARVPTQPTEGAKAAETQVSSAPNAITGNSYKVVSGDHLWNIAVAAYGDGYKWVEIARVNNLKNPNVIHVGNVLTLPR